MPLFRKRRNLNTPKTTRVAMGKTGIPYDPIFGADLPTQETDVLKLDLAECATALFLLDKN